MTTLAPREREVLSHLAEGRTTAQTARRMGISPHTAESYLRRIRTKTGVASRVQLALLAHRMDAQPPSEHP